MISLLIVLFDLTASDGGFVDTGQTGQWGWADPAAGPVGLGACWGTNPDGAYLHDTVDTLTIPALDLTGLIHPVVMVRHWYDIAAGDLGIVEVDDGSGWVRIEPVFGYPDPAGFVGQSNAYVEHAFDLSSLGTSASLRLSFAADPNGAAPGWYVQEVSLWDGDVVAPALGPVVSPTDTQDLDGPYPLTVWALDDVGVEEVQLTWRADEGSDVVTPMVDQGAGQYTAALPGQAPDTVVSWSVTATDGGQVSRWPAVGESSFRVFLAAPTGLSGPLGSHAVAQSADLTWDPPDSPHPVDGYEVIHQGVPQILVVESPRAKVDLDAGDSQHFEVRALYDVGGGDLSEPLQLDLEVAELIGVVPATAIQGEQLYVKIEGRSLYLLKGDTQLDAGDGVSVWDLDVGDSNTVTARFEVDPQAKVGPRDLTFTGSTDTWVFRSAFEITSDALAPQVVTVTPDAVIQGAEVAMEIAASVPFARVPTVDADDEMFVTGEITAAGDTVTFGLAASSRARVGEHTLVIDDGAHRYVVGVEVTEFIVPPSRACATGRGGVGALGVSAGLLLWGIGGRRRRS